MWTGNERLDKMRADAMEASRDAWRANVVEYRRLSKGEIIQDGDEVDASPDGWHDDPVWKPAKSVGDPAPDPQYPAHRQYRRPVAQHCPSTRPAANRPKKLKDEGR